MKIKSVLFVCLIVFSTVYIPKDVDVIKENLVIDSFVPRLDSSGNNTTAYVKYSNSTGTYLTSEGETTQLEGIGSSFQSSFAISEESNATHIFIVDPTNQTDGYWIDKTDSYLELNGSRGQTFQHYYNVTSGEYTYGSSLLVNKTDVIEGTDWVTTEEYPNRFIIRLTDGTIVSSDNLTQISNYFSTLDNSTIWAVGVEGFDGIMGFYMNFADLDWGHGQYLYWPRLKNGQITDYNEPLYAIYSHLYVNYTGTIYDQLLNDRSLYEGITDPRDNLSFEIVNDTLRLEFNTYGITILGSTWDFVQGFKYNITERLFHQITEFRCQNQNFQDIGMAYEITSSPQSDGTQYQPDRFVLSNETHSVVLNLSQAWNAGTYLEDYYSKVEIVSQNNESIVFTFNDMENAGFTEKYLNLHDQQFPDGSIRKTLRAGMYGYGSYVQGTIIEIDPDTGSIYCTDNEDLIYKVQDTSWIGYYTNIHAGEDEMIGAITWIGYIRFDTGLTGDISGITTELLNMYVVAEYFEAGEGVDCQIYSVDGDGDEAAEDSLSYTQGTYYTSVTDAYVDGVTTSSYNAASGMDTLLEYWRSNKGSNGWVNLRFYPNAASDYATQDMIHFHDTSGSNDPYLSFTYSTNTAPNVPTLNTDSGNTYGGKSHTIITDHTDDDGDADIATMYIQYYYSGYNVTLSCPQASASGSTTVIVGGTLVVGTPTYSHNTDPTNGYRVTWTIILDWDFVDDTAYTVYAKTVDSAPLGCAWTSLDANNLFENDLIVYSMIFTLSSSDYSEDGNTALTDDEWFRGGVDIVASGVITYEGTTNVYPDTDEGIDVSFLADGSERTEDTTLAASGVFSCPTYETTTGDNNLDIVYALDCTINDIPTGGSESSTGAAAAINVKRDNEIPTMDGMDVSGSEGARAVDDWDQDGEDFSINPYMRSDGSGSGVYRVYYEVGDSTPDLFWSNNDPYIYPVDVGGTGTYTFYAQVKDYVGNGGIVRSDNGYVDTTDPILLGTYFTNEDYDAGTTCWFDQGDTATANFDIPFTETNMYSIVVTATGGLAPTDWSSGGSPFTSTISITGKDDMGAQTISITITDKAGRTDTDYAGDNAIALDNTVPTATSYLHADSATGGYAPQNGYDDDLVADYTLLGAADSGVGLHGTAYKYNWNGGAYGGYSSDTTPEVSVADGDSADSDMIIRDLVGNEATIDGENIIIDDDDPSGYTVTMSRDTGFENGYYAYLNETQEFLYYNKDVNEYITLVINDVGSCNNSGYYRHNFDQQGAFSSGNEWETDWEIDSIDLYYLDETGESGLYVAIVNNAGNYQFIELCSTTVPDIAAPTGGSFSVVADSNTGQGYDPDTGYYDDDSVDLLWSGSIVEPNAPYSSGFPTNYCGYRIDTDSWIYYSSTSYEYTSVSDGSHDFDGLIRDNVGNLLEVSPTTIEVDTSDPSGFTITWTHANGWGSSDYAYLSGSTIYFNSGENDYFTTTINNDGAIGNSGYWQSVFDVNSIIDSQTVDTSGLPDSDSHYYQSAGVGSFLIRLVNNAGNYQEFSYTTDPDTTAPTTTFSSLSENPNSNYQYISGQICYFSDLMGGSDVFFDVTVTAGDTEAGVYGVRMSVWDDDSDSYDSSSPYTRQYSTDSTETSGSINLYTYDQVGNFDASPVVITMTEDLVVTSIGLDSETESSDYLYKEYGSGSQGCYGSQMGSTQTYTIAGSASDSGSGLFSIVDNTAFGNNPSNGGSLSSWSFAYEIDSADNGDVTVTYTVTDNVGNTDTDSYNFYEDNTAPTGFSISLTVDSSANIGYLPNTGYYDDDSVDVSVSGGSDAFSGLPSIRYAYQRNALGYGSYTSSSTNTFTSVEDGSHTLYVKMRDNVYNEASPDSIGVVVDTDNPISFTLTLSRLTGIEYTYYAYLLGSTIYFNSAQTDYFTVQVNDDGTIQNSNFWKTEWDKNSVFETGNNDSSGLPDSKNFNYNGDSSGSFLIRLVNNAGNYQTLTYTATEDTTAPTMTFGLFQDPYAFNFYSSTTCYTNVSSQNDGSSGLPTNFLAYKLNSGSYGSWNATTDKTWNAIESSNNTLYAKIRDTVGNERIYSDWVYPDTTIPILGWLTINETYSPNWFDQTISTTVWIHVNWIESYPYHVNITISGSLTASDDLTPSGSSSNFYSTITSASDGSYSITIVIYDKAGNSDSTLIGSEAPIQLESGMSDDVQEFYYYFYLVQSDGGIGLVWRDFNCSYVLDEAYRNYTEVSLRGDFVGRIWLNQTSSIRIITKDWFGDVIYNQSFVLPPSKDKILVLAVNTFKVVNLFQGVINMTIEYPEVGSFNYTEQLMPNEIFSWILGATIYNITCMVHLENTYATDEQDNELNDFQVDLSLSDISIFIDAVSTTFNIEVGSFSISDDFVNVFVTSSYDCSYTIYENDSSTASGSIDKDGTSISHSRDTTAGAYIDLAYKFVYGSDIIWFNTTYSNSAPTIFTVNIGSISYSDAYVDLYALSSKNCDVYIYENDTLEGTTSISTTGASIRHNKDTTSGATILLAYKFSDGSTDIWYNTSYNNAEDPTIMPTWSNVFSNNSAVEFGESKIVAWFYNELADWEIWLNGSLEQTGTSSYPQFVWDTSSCSLAWYNFTLQVTSTSTATNSSYIRVQVADTTAPTITYDNSTVNNTNIEWGTTYNLSWSFSESCSYEILLNGSSQTTGSGTSVDWSLDTTDLYHNYWYNITIEVTDSGSNTISESLFFYNRDSIAPAITIGFSSKTYYYSELGEHTFTWTVYDLHNYNASLLIDNVNTLNYTLDTVTELIIVTIIMELGTKNYKLTVYDSAGNYASDTVQITIVVSQTDGQGQPDPPTTPDTPDSLVEDDFLGKLLKTLPFLIFGIGGIVGLIVGIFLAKKFGLWGKFMEKVSEYL